MEDTNENNNHAHGRAPTNAERSASTPNSTSAGQNNHDSNSNNDSSTKAPKDRRCPFCGQAFTSSSLGRHLDLYIKPRNPKPPDGVHHVDEIRKLRGAITRRQPRTSIQRDRGRDRDRSRDRDGDGDGDGDINGHGGADRGSSANPSNETSKRQRSSGPFLSNVHTARHTPTLDLRDAETSPLNSPINPRHVHESQTYINKANWQATGVINNLPPRAPSRSNGEQPSAVAGQAQRTHDTPHVTLGRRPDGPQYEGDGMWRLQEAAEVGRAAEIALREVLGSLEAAAKKLGPRLLFDEFDFYALSFPGLCLAILPAPTTLFSPTPFPSAESWTLSPPGRRQFEAMGRYLNERSVLRRQTEHMPDSILFKHHTHLSGAWEHWESMSESDRASAWQLEILRSFTRGQEKSRQLNSELEQAQQHARHLEAEFDRLSRCQLPREYLLNPPNTIPISSSVVRELKQSQFKTGVAEVEYDAEALLAKWRATIRATTRPSRTHHAPPHTQPAEHAAESGHLSLRDDMVMNGSVWNIGGPLPRPGLQPEGALGQPSMLYETPPQPGTVVGADDEDRASNAGADAEGETDDDTNPPYHRGQDALTRRRTGHQGDGNLFDGVAAAGRPVNRNGKRPLPPSAIASGRPTTRILKERL